jgi:hypothetical protein
VNCRHCGTPLTHTFVDLGFAPPSNAYLTEQDLSRPETWYPLKTKVCDNCWLVQTEDYTDADSAVHAGLRLFLQHFIRVARTRAAVCETG